MAAVHSDIRERVKQGIDRADDTTVKMILAMLEVHEREAGTVQHPLVITDRFEEYEKGAITPVTLDELKTRVRKSHKEP